MDPFKGLLVHVISNGQVLESYDDPDASDHEDPYQRQRYIEAVTGATFAVKMIITDQFDFCHISRKDGIEVRFRIDGNDMGVKYYQTRAKIEERLEARVPYAIQFDELRTSARRLVNG